MKKLFLLDVSNFIFRAYYALPPMSNERGEATHALYGFIRSVQKLIEEFGVEEIVAVFDGPGGKEKRASIYEQYKAHRKETPEDLPHQIRWVHDYCALAGISELCEPGVEADDVIGSVAVAMANRGYQVYLCSSDKDLAQLVTKEISMLQIHKGNLIVGPEQVEEIYGVRPDQVVDLLAIMGDASDNIPGLPGFGPKTATKLLQEFGTLEAILAHPDKVAGKKKQETLRDEAPLALLSQELAKLDLAVEVPEEGSFYELSQPDNAALQEFFKDKGFKGLLRDAAEATPAKEAPAKGNYHLVDDEPGLANLVTLLKGHKEICFDTETTDTRPMRADLVGLGFAVEAGEAWYVPCNGQLGLEVVLSAFKPLFENPSHQFIGHNVKYDLHILANYGMQLPKLAFDTIIASYVVNSHSRRHSLDILALEIFNKVKTPIKALIGTGKKAITMAEAPIPTVADYCCEDVDYTLRLKEHFEPLLKDRNLARIFYEIEMPLLPILVKMERNGIFVDTSVLDGLASTFNKRIDKLKEEIYQLADCEFAINSPKQLSEILYTKLGIVPHKKGKTATSTAADILEELRHDHEIVDRVLQFRFFDKLRSTYVESLPHEVNPNTGRIHCTFNQSMAATGRLACQDPNLQNIPVRSTEGREIRGAFKPEDSSWAYLSADYSQIELRLLAHLSEDPELVRAFNQGDDVHAYTASRIFDIPLEKVSKDKRFHAKAVNFGIIYGQSAFGLSQQLGITVRDARNFIEAYFARFSRVKSFLEECKATARETGRATTMTGRERLIPEITGRNAMARSAAERLAVNTPLQGSSADITKLAMLAVDKAMVERKMESLMLLQVHDELIFEVPPGELSELKSLVKKEMEGVMSLHVPLIVDLAVGENWKEC